MALLLAEFIGALFGAVILTRVVQWPLERRLSGRNRILIGNSVALVVGWIVSAYADSENDGSPNWAFGARYVIPVLILTALDFYRLRRRANVTSTEHAVQDDSNGLDGSSSNRPAKSSRFDAFLWPTAVNQDASGVVRVGRVTHWFFAACAGGAAMVGLAAEFNGSTGSAAAGLIVAGCILLVGRAARYVLANE